MDDRAIEGEKRWSSGSELARALAYEWRTRRAWGSWRAAVRGLWWGVIRRYAYEICEECGRPVSAGIGGTYWRSDDRLWVSILGSGSGVLCPACFTRRCDERGISVHWEPVWSHRSIQGGAAMIFDHIEGRAYVGPTPQASSSA